MVTEQRDYYDVLGVARDADPKAIKLPERLTRAERDLWKRLRALRARS